MQVVKSLDHTSFYNSLPFSLGFCLIWLFSAFLPHRGSWPLHSLILSASFSVLVQETLKCRLECKFLVPPLIHLPFADFWVSWLDHPRSSVLRWGDLTGPVGSLTSPVGGLIGYGSSLTMALCHRSNPSWQSDRLDGGRTAYFYSAAVGSFFPLLRAKVDASAFPAWLPFVEPLMVIVIVSSPSGSFSTTTLRDGVDSASFLGLGLPMTIFFPFIISACSGRIRTIGFSKSSLLTENGHQSICISLRLNHPSLMADCTCRWKTLQLLVA
jgi:hypothetical protein